MDQSFTCPSCGKKAVPIWFGIVNVMMLLCSPFLRCGHCRTKLKLIRGTKRLLILCAVVGWFFGVIVAETFQSIAAAAVFFLTISIPAILNRRFFDIK